MLLHSVKQLQLFDKGGSGESCLQLVQDANSIVMERERILRAFGLTKLQSVVRVEWEGKALAANDSFACGLCLNQGLGIEKNCKKGYSCYLLDARQEICTVIVHWHMAS